MFQGSYKEGFNILLLILCFKEFYFYLFQEGQNFSTISLRLVLSMLYIKGNFQCVSRMFEGPLNTLGMFQDFMSYLLKYKGWF